MTRLFCTAGLLSKALTLSMPLEGIPALPCSMVTMASGASSTAASSAIGL